VFRCTGIPVSVGIAPTRTLAKLANRYAKKKHRDLGVHWLANETLRVQALQATPIGDVWGIGHEYAAFLSRHGFNTAAELCEAPDDWVREQMTVVGQRLLNELRGTPCMEWDFEPKKKKNICTSRSFGKLTQDKSLLAEAISNHAASCSQKLRKEKSCARMLNVFITTNPFRTEHQQYSHSIDLEMQVASNNASEIIGYCLKGLDLIFRPGLNYMKCGVVVSELVPEDSVQTAMFDGLDRLRDRKVMDTMDKLNRSLGKEIVRFAVQGFEKRYRLKAEHLSPCYTTKMSQILKVYI